jgi:hypothetical protein
VDKYDWTQQLKGGDRVSAYSKAADPKKRETVMERFRREAAEMKRKIVDEYSK